MRWLLLISLIHTFCLQAAPGLGNRLVYLDDTDPFHVGPHFPRLTTPQWVGEPGVEAVVTLGIDDMSQSDRYERFLRPILERLQRIDGRAPVSIFSNALNPEDPRLASWLKEGLSLEVHTLSHPCPVLAKHDFIGAAKTVHGGVDLLHHVPGNRPVAFRTPCCDSINSPSPRLYAEVLARTNAAGQFLRIDSSVLLLLTSLDRSAPSGKLVDESGRGRFTKYVPFPSFMTTVEDYPYPWVIGKTLWEFPCMAPSDWEAQNILGPTNAQMVVDWKAALDITVLKQGNFNFVFHPHGWSSPEQMIEFLDHAVARHGSKVRFLNYREADERLTQHLGAGEPLRAADGGDNGLRLLDLDSDGLLDVVIGNDSKRLTRVWNPAARRWLDSGFPTALVTGSGVDRRETGVRFGVVHPDGRPTLLRLDEAESGCWSFEEGRWVSQPALLNGLDLEGQPVRIRTAGRDQGVRFRDVDGDGIGEILVSNPLQNAIFRWSPSAQRWQRESQALPPDTSIVDEDGEDNGLRFVDVNEDGHDDVLFSNGTRFALWLYVPKPFLGWQAGWSRKAQAGVRSGAAIAAGTPPDEIPPIVRPGPHRNNGAWIRSRHLWVQNEDTAHLPDLVDHRSFEQLLRGAIPDPKSPEQALASFQAAPGFRVDLVASEPLVQDPVAFDWDAEGRLWVVEMRDYPLGLDGKGQPGGVVKVLEDADGDGRMDRVTEFLRGVPFPSSVQPWRRGVLVTAAPQLFYAEDIDGDGRADRRRVLFEGFVEGNQQHRVNGFALGLDGWMYAANGDSGGEIRSSGREERWTGSAWEPVPGVSESRAPRSVSIQGKDFRFRPDTLEIEAIEGQTQYGRVRDDWGHWYGNANYTWLWTYPIASRYVARNPFLPVRDLRVMLAQGPEGNRVFPISRALPRPNVVGDENTVTSGCSPTPYRDDLFGPEFARTVFISEPSENLIHREVLEGDDLRPTSRRAAGEERREFLASTDSWFRPIQTKTGPDGALYMADMYRLVLEHPEWIPADQQRNLNLRAGEDRGRLYRMVPTNAVLRRIPNLAALDTVGLVSAMDTPNGWQRDTVFRLLLERADRRAVRPLRSLLGRASDPRVRVQALAALGVLGGLTVEDLVHGLRDPHPGVVAQAIRASEPFLVPPRGSRRILEALLTLKGRRDVALPLALVLGASSDRRVGPALVDLAARDPESSVLRTAVLSSSLGHVDGMLAALERMPAPSAPLLESLVDLAVRQKKLGAVLAGMRIASRLEGTRGDLVRFRLLDRALKAERGALTWAQDGLAEPFRAVAVRAADRAVDPSASEEVRIAALGVLGHPGIGISMAPDRWRALFDARNSPSIQSAALQALLSHPDQGAIVFAAWQLLGPGLRGQALTAFWDRPVWCEAVLAEVASGRWSSRDLGVGGRQRLRDHPDASVRARARDLLDEVKTDRGAVVEAYGGAAGKAGNLERGRDLFVSQCAACHRVKGLGVDVGPDLGAVVDKTPEALRVAILDPNRAVEERYLAYGVRTAGGEEFTGIVVGESPNSLTLRAATGLERVFLRGEVASLTSTGRSLMPEGFEHAIDPEAMTDLIAFLTAQGSRPKEFAGNHPEVVMPDDHGVLHLTAARAEIFGDSLVFEAGYGNLGYWQSDSDLAVWTVEIPGPAVRSYDLSWDWARPGGMGPGVLVVQGERDAMEVSLPATGSWDVYRQRLAGTVRLEPGRHRLRVRARPPVTSTVIDLRELQLVPRDGGT
ncbi:MAG: PVC-type heme-binding CxxCH protein [Limisphaerales bacterium]